jgi:phage terminase small subunit
LFVAEYQKDHNGTQAAIRAGYAANSAAVTASKLLRKANVRSAIANQTEQRIAQVAHETGITLERTLREIAKGAFFDPRNLFHPDGRPKEIPEIDADTAAVLAGMDVLEEYRGSGEAREFVGYVKKYKLADRKGYLDMLMKHLGGYAKDNEQSKPETPPAAATTPNNQMAREFAYALQLGLRQANAKASNDPSSPPRQAAS